LGLVAIAFAIQGPAGVIAGIALAFHHALVKPALFMLTEAWGGHINKLMGASQVSMLSTLLFCYYSASCHFDQREKSYATSTLSTLFCRVRPTHQAWCVGRTLHDPSI